MHQAPASRQIVFQQMLEDSLSARGRAREDAGETTLTPSAAGSHPHTSSSDNSLPRSSPTSLKHTPDGVLTQNGSGPDGRSKRCAAYAGGST
jgi:hypothetical protein